MKKKILIIGYFDFYKDPRSYRQITNLKNEYEVTCVGTHPPRVENVRFIPLKLRPLNKLERILELIQLKVGLYDKVYWRKFDFNTETKKILKNEKFDLIITHNYYSIPAALSIANGAKIIVDEHEYPLTMYEEKFFWRFFYKKFNIYICKKYLPKIDKLLTVCDSISDKFKQDLGIESIVLTNATEHINLSPSKTDNKIKIIYHGRANSFSRKMDSMIKLMDYLDEKFYLDLMLIAENDYIKTLKGKIVQNSRIKIIPPVPRKDIISFTNKYDIGLFFIQKNTSFNVKHSLPNKLFEYIQARLMVVSGPYPEINKIIKNYNCGIFNDNFNPENLAKQLNALSIEDIENYKKNSDKAAKEINSEKNIILMKDLVKELLCAE